MSRDGTSINRLLAIGLHGFSFGIYQSTDALLSESTISSGIDVTLDVTMSSTGISVSIRLSDLLVRLASTDYITIRRIVRDNLGRKMDTSMWENVERAWENEVTDDGDDQAQEQAYSHEVIYSSSARLVQYGRPKKGTERKYSSQLTISLGSLSFVLRRDDVSAVPTTPYDMLLLQWQGVEVELGQKDDGDIWLNLSVGNVFAFDLGKVGRLERKQGKKRRSDDDATNSLSVLVEGYSPVGTLLESDCGSEFDSHLVVKLDKEKTSGAVKVVVIVNYLSLTAFVGPLDDLIQFFTCRLSCPASNAEDPRNPQVTELVPSKLQLDHESKAEKYDWQLRFVSHYPRLVLAADEIDVHSRALVVQG
jgi:hypothetical protein